MNFYLIGIDYKSANLDIREESYRRYQEITGFWNAHPSQKARLLSTCNRIEVYAMAEDEGDFRVHAELFYSKFSQFLHKGYSIYGESDVFRHALRLAAGLESQLKGEREIIQQLDAWHLQPDFPEALAALWRAAVFAARRIRNKAGLNGESRSIADIILNDLAGKIDKVGRIEVVIAGTGKIAGLFADKAQKDVRLWFVANKNHIRARRLAEISNGNAISFENLPGILARADVFISATKSPHIIFKTKDISAAVNGRGRPLYLYDVAVPRDMDPEIARIKGAVLKDLDDLSENFNRYNEAIAYKVSLAEYLVEKELMVYERVAA